MAVGSLAVAQPGLLADRRAQRLLQAGLRGESPVGLKVRALTVLSDVLQVRGPALLPAACRTADMYRTAAAAAVVMHGGAAQAHSCKPGTPLQLPVHWQCVSQLRSRMQTEEEILLGQQRSSDAQSSTGDAGAAEPVLQTGDTLASGALVQVSLCHELPESSMAAWVPGALPSAASPLLLACAQLDGALHCYAAAARRSGQQLDPSSTTGIHQPATAAM